VRTLRRGSDNAPMLDAALGIIRLPVTGLGPSGSAIERLGRTHITSYGCSIALRHAESVEQVSTTNNRGTVLIGSSTDQAICR